jgi:hypothetical protein
MDVSWVHVESVSCTGLVRRDRMLVSGAGAFPETAADEPVSP